MLIAEVAMTTEVLVTFLAPAIAAGLLFIMMLLSGDSDSEVEVDADLDIGDVALEVDADLDVDVDMDADFDVDGDGHEAAASGFAGQLLGLLGLGKAPLSILIFSWGILWCVIGLTVYTMLPSEYWYINQNALHTALVAALVGTLVIGRMIAGTIGAMIPSKESHTVSLRSLKGQNGMVLHTVSQVSGTVRLTDRLGHLRDVQARTHEGENPILKGARVKLSQFVPASRIFLVREV